MVGRVLWSGSKDLMQRIMRGGYLMIEVRPEGYKDGLCSDITLNRRDMRSKFGHATLDKIVS